MYPHRIRLRGPWECEPIGPDAPRPRRVTMPCGWDAAGLTEYRGTARFSRKFGYPGKADREIEHFWLICDTCIGCRAIHLNDQLLSSESRASFAFDVTPLIQDRNRLDVLIDGGCDGAGLWGEVVLEIRRDAYLDEINIERGEARVQISGKAVGTASQALELYTLVDNRNVDYRTIMPTATGQVFMIDIGELAPESQSVRLELVHVSTVWYRIELPIPCWKS
jgi:hypothetical protein